MIKRDTDVEVVSKATTNQRIGRSNVKMKFENDLQNVLSYLLGKVIPCIDVAEFVCMWKKNIMVLYRKILLYRIHVRVDQCKGCHAATFYAATFWQVCELLLC